MINSSIMSIREMIDTAFGDPDVNKVNFKIVQTILLILARQLRILERQVGFNFGPGNIVSTSSLSITELKLKSKVTEPKKRRQSKASNKISDAEATDDIISLAKSKVKSRRQSKIPTQEELKKKDYLQYIEEIELNREHELRVVHQRANSREEAEKPPTPMASLDLKEKMQYEKILVVERMPKDETSKKIDTTGLSIVTQEQFEELHNKVKELQVQFGTVGVADFPENLELMKELRSGASLTDAMAALQLSARIDAAEKTLEQLMSLLTDLTSRKGFGLEKAQSSEELSKAPRWVSAEELENTMKAIRDEITKKVTNITDRSVHNADTALQIAVNLEKELTSALKLDNRMNELENQVSEYADKINILDASLSGQMTQYQEQLTQMQHDLETGIDTMAEASANATGDPAAVAELNAQLTNFQMDIDFTNTKQRELNENQNILSSALQDLLQQIELLRESKSDREEVTDAFRDKAGIDALNGLVTQQEFFAIRGDFEKRIKSAYNKFDSQELKWQQAIDDLQRKLDERADLTAVIKLRDDVNEYLEMLKTRMQAIMEIVGEPRAAAVSKILFRDAACISCSSPAHMNITEPNMVPALPAVHKAGLNAEETNIKPKQDGDHGICYPGQPIPHPIDPSKVHVCRRYCGGLHTVTNARNKLSTGVAARPIRNLAQEVGTDGKMYVAEDGGANRATCAPCICNILLTSGGPNLVKQVIENQELSMGTLPSDFTPHFNSYDGSRVLNDGVDVTPPCIEE